MFEYFNIGAFCVLIFLVLVVAGIKKEGLPILLILSTLVVTLLLYGAYSSYSDVKSNIKHFQSGDTLVCSSGGGVYSAANKYSVSKKEGWILRKNYFIKDSLMIHAKKCKEQ
jgi:hypothetical protein